MFQGLKFKLRRNSPAGKKMLRALDAISRAINHRINDQTNEVLRKKESLAVTENTIQQAKDKKAEARNNFGGVYDNAEMSQMEREADDARAGAEIQKARFINEVANTGNDLNKVKKLEKNIDGDTLKNKDMREAMLDKANGALDGETTTIIRDGMQKFDKGLKLHKKKVAEAVVLTEQLDHMDNSNPEKIKSGKEKKSSIAAPTTKEPLAFPEPIEHSDEEVA